MVDQGTSTSKIGSPMTEQLQRFYGYRTDGNAHVLARVRAPGQAERLTDTTGPHWQPLPSLDHLAYSDPDMSWDDLTHDQAAAFAAELGYPRSVLDQPV